MTDIKQSKIIPMSEWTELTYTKSIQSVDNNRKREESRIPHIYQIEFRLNDLCNLDCEYCQWKSGPSYDYSDIVLCIEWIGKFCSNNSITDLNVYFHGGEPTLHPKIKEILIGLKNLKPVNVTTEVQTNLILTTPKLKGILPYIDYLDVSLHYAQYTDKILKIFNSNIEYLVTNNKVIHNFDIMLENIDPKNREEYYSYIKNLLTLPIITNAEMIYNFYDTYNLDQHKKFYNDFNVTEQKYHVGSDRYVNTNDLYEQDLDFRGWWCGYFDEKLTINGNGDLHYCDTSMTQAYKPFVNIIKDPRALLKASILKKTGIMCKWDKCVCCDVPKYKAKGNCAP